MRAFYPLEDWLPLDGISDPVARDVISTLIAELDILRVEAWQRQYEASPEGRRERLAELSRQALAKLARSDIESLRAPPPRLADLQPEAWRDLRKDLWRRLPDHRKAAVRQALKADRHG